MNVNLDELFNKTPVPPSALRDGVDGILDMSGNLEFKCIYCGGTGIKANGEPCEQPECGKKREETLEVIKHSYPFLIPTAYKEVNWTYEKAMETVPRFKDKYTSYENVCRAMDRILQRAKSNTLLKDRILLSLAPNMGRRTWAYTVLKTAYDNGISVHPLRMLYSIDLEEALHRQLLILNVTKIDFKDNMEKLDYILEAREMKDLVTIVISNVNVRYFVSKLDNQPIHFDMAIGYNL